MSMTSVTCDSWDSFITSIRQFRATSAHHTEFLFRDHGSAEWRLRSSLARIALDAQLDEFAAIRVEQRLLHNFIPQAHLLLPTSLLFDESQILDWWTVMQHYRAPTRLLDWTRSPYVALYFAVVECPSKDGAVWALNGNALAGLVNKSLVGPDGPLDQKDFFWKTRVAVQFLLALTKRPNERMNAQQGVFTVANGILPEHEQLLDRLPSPHGAHDLVKLVIRADAKVEILGRLTEMNVHGLSLFPGIDGVGSSIRELAVIQAAEERNRASIKKSYP